MPCKWTPPSRVPGLVPWLLILVLLALRINHTFDAWFAVVPILVLLGVQAARNFLSNVVSTGELDMLITTGKLMGFALCGVWLLLPLLKARNRFLTFLKTVPVLWVISTMTAWAETAWEDSVNGDKIGLMVTAAVLGVVCPLVLMLASRMCRKNYGRWRFAGWMAVFSVATATLGLLPFAIFAWIAHSGPSLLQLASLIGIIAGLIFVSLLLFVTLSWVNRFHGERFLLWLGLVKAEGVKDGDGQLEQTPLCSLEASK